MATSVRGVTRGGRAAIAERPAMASVDAIPSVDKATIVVIDQRVLVRECLVRCLRMTSEKHVVLAFSTLAEWQDVERNYPPAALIMSCSQGRSPGDFESRHNLPFVAHDGTVVPVVIISDKEDADDVLAALESGARGYIPTSLTLDVAVGAVQFVEAGGTFVPASSLSSRARERPLGRGVPVAGLFTARQSAVLECLRKGKANKQIAYELNMREGTVKVHVRNIMKKLKARNRTEVAVLTSSMFADRDAG
jgi:DNA-binding NarL/FixJ family response regulator